MLLQKQEKCKILCLIIGHDLKSKVVYFRLKKQNLELLLYSSDKAQVNIHFLAIFSSKMFQK